MKKYFGAILLIFLSAGILLTAQKASPESDFEYDLNKEGTGVVIKNYQGSAEEVVIPSIIEGFPVTELARGAFYSNGCIVSVVIPDSILTLGVEVFEWCQSLKTVILPKGIKAIPEGFFKNSSLESITIPDSVLIIYRNAFQECFELKTVTIGKGIKSIGNYAFWLCNNLTTFNIGVQKLEATKDKNGNTMRVFKDDDNSEYGYGYSVFSGCSSLGLKEQKKIRDTGYTDEF